MTFMSGSGLITVIEFHKVDVRNIIVSSYKPEIILPTLCVPVKQKYIKECIKIKKITLNSTETNKAKNET